MSIGSEGWFIRKIVGFRNIRVRQCFGVSVEVIRDVVQKLPSPSMSVMGHRTGMSPEASAAAALFDVVRPRLVQSMYECVGARELEAMGYRADVDVAAALDVSLVVPTLVGGAFRLPVAALPWFAKPRSTDGPGAVVLVGFGLMPVFVGVV